MAPHPELRAIPWSARPLLDIREGRAEATDAVSVQHGFAGIAETGTLMLPSAPERPVTLNLLADTEIVVLRASAVVGAYEEAWDRLRAEVGAMPRNVMLITGPSRSADIEQTLELGGAWAAAAACGAGGGCRGLNPPTCTSARGARRWTSEGHMRSIQVRRRCSVWHRYSSNRSRRQRPASSTSSLPVQTVSVPQVSCRPGPWCTRLIVLGQRAHRQRPAALQSPGYRSVVRMKGDRTDDDPSAAGPRLN